jgi:hypothetical protein
VVAASVTDCAEELLLKATDDEERPQVVGFTAPEGEVTAQTSDTVPVNELDGVTLTVVVLPLVAPGATRMFPPFVSVKLVLPLLGACQKSPQPAKPATNGAAASNNHAHFPIFIAAPLAPYSAARSQVTASPRILSRCRTLLRAHQAHYGSRRNPAGIRLSVAWGRQP